MRRLLLTAVITATVLPTLISAASKCYDVVPYSNYVAQVNTANCYLTQSFRNTLDSLVTASVWIGNVHKRPLQGGDKGLRQPAQSSGSRLQRQS